MSLGFEMIRANASFLAKGLAIWYLNYCIGSCYLLFFSYGQTWSLDMFNDDKFCPCARMGLSDAGSKVLNQIYMRIDNLSMPITNFHVLPL